jgi:zinc protease
VIGALDRDAVLAHHERLVKRSNLVIAVSGDVDPDAVARGLTDRLAALDGGAFARPAPPLEEPPREIRRAELIKDRAQAHLVIGFRGVSVDDEDRFALEVISQLLAGQSGRLFLELRDKQGLAYSVTASSVEGVAPGYFAVYIATAPEKLSAAREGLLGELRRLIDSEPRAAELEAARRHLIGNFAIDHQRNAVHAAQTSLNALYGLGADASRAYPDRIGAVSGKDVLRVAQRIVVLDAYTEAVVRGTQ